MSPQRPLTQDNRPQYLEKRSLREITHIQRKNLPSTTWSLPSIDFEWYQMPSKAQSKLYRCLRKVGVELIDVRDERGRLRFVPSTLSYLLHPTEMHVSRLALCPLRHGLMGRERDG